MQISMHAIYNNLITRKSMSKEILRKCLLTLILLFTVANSANIGDMLQTALYLRKMQIGTTQSFGTKIENCQQYRYYDYWGRSYSSPFSGCQTVCTKCSSGCQLISNKCISKSSASLILKAKTNECIYKTYNLEEGPHEISFKYQASYKGTLANDTKIVVYWNGVLVDQIIIDDKDLHEQSIEVDAEDGINNLTICLDNAPASSKLEVCITKLKVTQLPCIPVESQNLIINGGFQMNNCGSHPGFCRYVSGNSSGVPGWEPDPQMQIGTSQFYNPAIGTNNWITELGWLDNTCISQPLTLSSGNHRLQFQWAARNTAPAQYLPLDPQDSDFIVYIGPTQIAFIQPSDFFLHSQTINFTVNDPITQNELRFCGFNTDNNGISAIIDNVELYYLDLCQVTNSETTIRTPAKTATRTVRR